jgi:hypothetical protein
MADPSLKPTGCLFLILFLGLLGCKRTDPATEKDLATPVVPLGFNEKSLDQIKCPENGSTLRFATKRELDDINQRIGVLKLKTWFDNTPRQEPVDAVLIRADGKIGYRVDGVMPILKIEDALVLNDRVGPPDAKKNRK